MMKNQKAHIMNLKKWRAVLVIFGLGLLACNNGPRPELSAEAKEEDMHGEHANLADNLAHQGIILLEEQYKVPREFGYQMDTFFNDYLLLEKALVDGDKDAANKAAGSMEFQLGMIADPIGEGKVAEAWANHKEGYLKNLKEMKHINSLEGKRSYFSHISEILYCTFKSFDIEVGEVQVVYCPMAFDNKGAYWLTNDKAILNPYFGKKMLKCGGIAEVIN